MLWILSNFWKVWIFIRWGKWQKKVKWKIAAMNGKTKMPHISIISLILTMCEYWHPVTASALVNGGDPRQYIEDVAVV